MTSSCALCGNSKDNTWFTARETMFGSGGSFRYVQCGECGCLQLHDKPADLTMYYAGEYYSLGADPAGESSPRRLLHSMRARHALRQTFMSRLLLRFFPNYALDALARIGPRPSDRILDVGCGSGSFLYWLREAGFQDLLGIDPFIASDIKHPNGVEIRKQTLEETRGTWDLILFFDSFEHMQDPVQTLRSASSLLSDHGTCLLTLPTVSSYAWETYGTDWVQLDAPRHFFLHSRKSLALLAQQTGLKLDRIVDISTEFQFWGSEQIKKGIPLMSERSYAKTRTRSMFGRGEIRSFKEKAKKLNAEGRGDHVAVSLKKKG